MLEKIVNEELQNISDWMRLNKPSINFAKTEYMVISNRKIDQPFKLTIEENQITQKKINKLFKSYDRRQTKLEATNKREMHKNF